MSHVRLTERMLQREGVVMGPSKLADATAFFHRDREFAHFHSDEEIDIRLPHDEQQEFVTLDPVRPRPHRSPWIAVRIVTEEDVDLALRMAERALAVLE